MRVSEHPLSLLAAEFLFAGSLLACSDEDRIWSPRLESVPSPAAIGPVSGAGQQSRAGEILPEPLVVRVTDAHHDGIANVTVTWTLESEGGGRGGFREENGTFGESTTVRTNASGLAEVFFRPVDLGAHRILATVDAGQTKLRARFTAHAAGVLIELWQPWNVFTGPDGSSDVQALVGSEVELAPRNDEARIVSTSTPPGGAAFDSGTLGAGERFLFVPEVAGTWEFRDELYGATGSLTVWEWWF